MNPVKKHRQTAFERQHGKCCYCGFSMWQDSAESFAKAHSISVAQARHFQCTAEHLVARQDGGPNTASNIAAACARCNAQRHKRKSAPEPVQYQAFVQKRLNKGAWHSLSPKAKLTRGKAPRITP